MNIAEVQEQADDVLLADVLERQRALADVELALAQLAYRGKALFIGGNCLPWGLLTPGQKAEELRQAKAYIQTPKGGR